MPTTTRKSAREKILDFRHYSKGWDYGEGKPFSPETIRRALLINRMIIAKCTPETDAFPGPDGDIMVTAYCDPWYWEFLIDASGMVLYIAEKDDVVTDEREGLSHDEALHLARRLTKQTWKFYASSTPLDTTAENSDSTAWPSSPLENRPESRSLTLPAFKTWAIHHVHTYDSTMIELPVPLLSFGNSTPIYCQTSA